VQRYRHGINVSLPVCYCVNVHVTRKMYTQVFDFTRVSVWSAGRKSIGPLANAHHVHLMFYANGFYFSRQTSYDNILLFFYLNMFFNFPPESPRRRRGRIRSIYTFDEKTEKSLRSRSHAERHSFTGGNPHKKKNKNITKSIKMPPAATVPGVGCYIYF